MPSPVANSTLLTVLIVDAGIQLLFYVHAAIFHTEKYYDFSGALTYLSCSLVSLLLRPSDAPLSSLSGRQIAASIMVIIWCLRLGSYLFYRILKTGDDKRFDSLKTNPISFAVPWSLQILWIWLTALPVWLVNGNVAMRDWWALDYVGIIIWALGFLMESIADYQKNAFKNEHPKDFISTGLYRYSRYPNYFGELVLWIGMFLLCCGGFTENWQWIGVISPVFVFVLLYFVSGVRMSENGSEERYGKREDFRRYKASTSTFVPWFPRKLPHDWKPPLLDAENGEGQQSGGA